MFSELFRKAIVFRNFGIALLLVLSPASVFAQAAPAVRGGGQSLWVGTTYSNFSPDFGPPHRLIGIGVNADLSWSPRLTLEGEMRFLRFNGFGGEHQDDYLLGPKFTLLRRGRFTPYAKFVFGLGAVTFPYQIGNGTYFVYAPGGGVDYRLSRKLSVRGGYEYQFWPSAPGIPGEPDNGMHPNGFSIGVAYRALCMHCY